MPQRRTSWKQQIMRRILKGSGGRRQRKSTPERMSSSSRARPRRQIRIRTLQHLRRSWNQRHFESRRHTGGSRAGRSLRKGDCSTSTGPLGARPSPLTSHHRNRRRTPAFRPRTGDLQPLPPPSQVPVQIARGHSPTRPPQGLRMSGVEARIALAPLPVPENSIRSHQRRRRWAERRRMVPRPCPIGLCPWRRRLRCEAMSLLRHRGEAGRRAGNQTKVPCPSPRLLPLTATPAPATPLLRPLVPAHFHRQQRPRCHPEARNRPQH
mmetsp:Transcript_32371/g.81794  ORF Transcript_32371/g.81794 Transcript_32371/m.81794 type:complete len:266 (+) Transcript_32371:303-1100(+)